MATKRPPLKKYKVRVWQEVTRWHTVVVEAESVSDAREKARDVTNEHSGPWEDEEVSNDGTDPKVEEVK